MFSIAKSTCALAFAIVLLGSISVEATPQSECANGGCADDLDETVLLQKFDRGDEQVEQPGEGKGDKIGRTPGMGVLDHLKKKIEAADDAGKAKIFAKLCKKVERMSGKIAKWQSALADAKEGSRLGKLTARVKTGEAQMKALSALLPEGHDCSSDSEDAVFLLEQLDDDDDDDDDDQDDDDRKPGTGKGDKKDGGGKGKSGKGGRTPSNFLARLKKKIDQADDAGKAKIFAKLCKKVERMNGSIAKWQGALADAEEGSKSERLTARIAMGEGQLESLRALLPEGHDCSRDSEDAFFLLEQLDEDDDDDDDEDDDGDDRDDADNDRKPGTDKGNGDKKDGKREGDEKDGGGKGKGGSGRRLSGKLLDHLKTKIEKADDAGKAKIFAKLCKKVERLSGKIAKWQGALADAEEGSRLEKLTARVKTGEGRLKALSALLPEGHECER